LGVGHERAAPRGIALFARVVLTFTIVTLGWVLFRAPTFGAALTVYHALFAGDPGKGLLGGWQAILAAGIVAFGLLRLLLRERRIEPSWLQLRPMAQIGTLAGLLLVLELLTWPGLSPTFIYFKF
jgi:hypothetical protein